MKKKSFDINKNHKVRMYYNGVRQKDIYPHLTDWEVFKLKVKKFFISLFRTIVWVGMIAIICLVFREVYPRVVSVPGETQTIIDSSLEDKIEQLKWNLVKDVFDKERDGHVEDDGLITFDPNPKNPKVEIPSIGGCQFKVPTMQEKYLKYYGDQLTRKEAILVSLDDNKCQDIMYNVIFKEKEGWRNWYTTCTKKVDCVERINRIKDLEK